jgi:outer membrane protein OmpA-like peptidoglycan-associated protein
VLARWVAAIALALPLVAGATDLSFKLEPGVAIPLTAPQSDRFDTGGAQSVKLLFGLTPYLDVGPAVTLLYLPTAIPGTDAGTAWGLGVGARLKRPHDAESAGGVSPWFDADLLYVRTGSLNRPGFDAAIGASWPIGEYRNFWIGPFLRYQQVIDNEKTGYDTRDAKILVLGVSFEFGSGLARKPAPEVVRTVTEERIVNSCPDRDGDGLPDDVDHCPDVAGPIDNWGCPRYEKVIVHKDKLELKEKIQFDWDEADIEPASHKALDEVVQALKDNKGFRVQIDGNASSEGGDEHNQALS